MALGTGVTAGAHTDDAPFEVGRLALLEARDELSVDGEMELAHVAVHPVRGGLVSVPHRLPDIGVSGEYQVADTEGNLGA